MYELVSIIIPVYNGGDYLDQAINSALKQTYNNIEILVINDGSNDEGETERIALSFGKAIRYFYKDNGGVSSALNLGIELMEGKYFSWLSHDDLYHPEKIASQVEMMKKQTDKKNIIFTNNKLIDENNKSIRLYFNKFRKNEYSPEETFKMLFSGKNFNGCSLLIPREALIQTGEFDVNYKYIQDWKMWVMLSNNGYRFIKVNKKYNLSRVHSNQQTIKIKDLYSVELSLFLKEVIEMINKQDKYFKDKIRNVYKFCVMNGIDNIANKKIFNEQISLLYRVSTNAIFGMYGKIMNFLKRIISILRR